MCGDALCSGTTPPLIMGAAAAAAAPHDALSDTSCGSSSLSALAPALLLPVLAPPLLEALLLLPLRGR